MNIAEKLYLTDPNTLLQIVVQYELYSLGSNYFSDRTLNRQTFDTERLMIPDAYSGRYERRNGAITQPHRLVYK